MTPLRLGLAALVLVCLAAGAVLGLVAVADAPGLRIGAKNFTESRILAELMAREVERATGRPATVVELGSTSLCVDALARGAIDAYPEYTGTLLADVFRRPPVADPDLGLAEVRAAAVVDGRFRVLDPFGFDNTYALAMRRDRAAALGIRRIGDLAAHPTLVFGFTGEFVQRPDGWPGLRRHYGLPAGTVPVELAPGHLYAAVRDGQVDVVSAFSTDARIARFDLVLLADDRRFFPAYLAVPLIRADAPPGLAGAWGRLAGRLDGPGMMALNAQADQDAAPVGTVAKRFLATLPP
ncbi:MAG: hypothetical protein RLZZ127_1796 [Planctomycetota bacterium]|jgi:glycine betaine/choline ABC-type transport system substrate-binding protein